MPNISLWRRNYLKTKKGFTLVEALAATCILAFCVGSLLLGLYNGYNLINEIRESIIVSSVIQEEIEELRKTFFTTLPPYGESSFFNNSLSLLYSASGTINVDQYLDENIARVLVKVTWHNRLKPEKQNVKKVVTLIARNGINSI